jgi:hypothetical protein
LRAERLATGAEIPLIEEQEPVAVWSEAKLRDRKKRKGRPATGRPSLSRENSSNGVRKRPSELSGEILLASERQCQGIFRE